jgi:peptide/nickel transport system permease protein
MDIQPVFLTMDWVVFLVLLLGGAWLFTALRREYWRIALRQVVANRVAMLSFGILCLYFIVGFLDTLHYKENSGERAGQTLSVLDRICMPLRERVETTYSAPLAIHQYTKETMSDAEGHQIRDYPRLKFAGENLETEAQVEQDVHARLFKGFAYGLGFGLLFLAVMIGGIYTARSEIADRRGAIRIALYVGAFLTVVSILAAEAVVMSANYHVFGTDKAGLDVFFAALKSVRTGLIIGTLTTLIVTPFAILFGTLAGYFGGFVDDAVQYIYTTLDSIPDILLIAAAMLIVQSTVSTEETIVGADRRLFFLCLILGITSWTTLCRFIRAEVLKLREIEYIQAADAFGIGHTKIMLKHLVPNVMHIVLISTVLRFSGLVLVEAVLAYIGIGVDPSMNSWGNMIHQSLQELARDPVVWWNLLAAFVFMLGLVLPANLFGDALRDALDPRLRKST